MPLRDRGENVNNKQENKKGKGEIQQNEQSEKLLSIWENNANGLKAKIDPLKANIDYYKH